MQGRPAMLTGVIAIGPIAETFASPGPGKL